MNEENLSAKGKLFKPRDAKLFKPRNALGNTGGQYYVAENPTFGAVFTYHLKDVPQTIKSNRKKMESTLNKQSKDIPFPGYDSLTKEMREKPAQLLLSINDSNGNLIRNVSKNATKGTGKIVWDLKHKSYNTITAQDLVGGKWQDLLLLLELTLQLYIFKRMAILKKLMVLLSLELNY